MGQAGVDEVNSKLSALDNSIAEKGTGQAKAPVRFENEEVVAEVGRGSADAEEGRGSWA